MWWLYQASPPPIEIEIGTSPPATGQFLKVDLRVEDRIAEIGSELRENAEAPSWAGVYMTGDGYESAHLHLGIETGFGFTRIGCVGLSSQDLGTVRAVGSRILLAGELEPNPGAIEPYPKELVHVLWGERSYLIAPDEMIAFGCDINAGIEPSEYPGGMAWLAQFLRPCGGQRERARAQLELAMSIARG
ncbi:MAG: hypothetical protein ACI8X5_003317, partial [Planctomycetota bacterium]